MSFLLSHARRIASAPSSIRAFSTSRPSQLARITLIGRLGNDVETKTSVNGQTRLEYSLATTSKIKGEPVTNWFKVVSFAQEGTPARSYIEGLSKGSLVYVEADARFNQFEDKDGVQRKDLNLTQTKIQVLQRSNSGEGQSAQ